MRRTDNLCLVELGLQRIRSYLASVMCLKSKVTFSGYLILCEAANEVVHKIFLEEMFGDFGLS